MKYSISLLLLLVTLLCFYTETVKAQDDTDAEIDADLETAETDVDEIEDDAEDDDDDYVYVPYVYGCNEDPSSCDSEGGVCSFQGICICNTFYSGDDCSTYDENVTFESGISHGTQAFFFIVFWIFWPIACGAVAFVSG